MLSGLLLLSAAFFFWWVVDAIRTGEAMRGSFTNPRRQEQPILFWWYIGITLLFGLVSLWGGIGSALEK